MDMLIPSVAERNSAMFFDFDGTLVDLAPQPDAVQVPAEVPRLLGRLNAALGGALAIVSGRPVAEIDHQLRPLRLCVAGVHGAERRGADGHIRRIAVGGLHEAAALIEALCTRHPALRMERKPGAIALHYRQAPELEDECLATMAQAIQRTHGMTLLRGKKVVEMKPRRASKGAAVLSFMDERRFRMRRPWFFGDDVTDEGAFETVQALGGVAVKIGDGETLASHRLPNPAALHAWLERSIEELPAPPPQKVPR
jgi:trehalose 6-phosphate phosphatase